MWDIYEERFIHNDAQYEVVLIIANVIELNCSSTEAQKLYNSLSPKEINYIKKRLDKLTKKMIY